MSKGSLIVVGTGIRLSEQCTPQALRCIRSADIVCAVCGDPFAQRWLETLNPNTVSLSQYYAFGRPPIEAYEAMTEAILEQVRSGKTVCAVFYGHPGVFVYPSHAAVERARAEGFEAAMLPAISSEDCLYADLGIDPGRLGCQSYEATDFVVYGRKVDPTAALILWQIGAFGDPILREMAPPPGRLRLLADILMEDYPPDHAVTIYEAATLPVGRPRIETLRLSELYGAAVTQQSTLFVPPVSKPAVSPERLAKLKAIRG
jgi:precorrin-6B methylase 1